MSRRPTRVRLEVGRRRVFADAVDWPGWCRSGRTEEAALATLSEYAPRYASVAETAGIAFPTTVADAFAVVERVDGSATTDFGAPDAVTATDREPTPAAAARRSAGLVEAGWRVFAAIAAESPEELRKGPRGGGRDRTKMIEHVIESEAAYARKIGVRHRPPAPADEAAVAALRADILRVLGTASTGDPPVAGGWPVRYAARRIAWHVLDHAWEMADRSG